MKRREFMRMCAAPAIVGTIRPDQSGSRKEDQMYGLIGKITAHAGKRDELIEVLLTGAKDMPGCANYAPGGQAGTSSRIENYRGFPAGISGSELTRRALAQAQRLGAEALAPLEVTGVSVDGNYKRLALSDGREVVTRTLLAATGMMYREHPAAGVAEHTGAGVYYGAVPPRRLRSKDAA